MMLMACKFIHEMCGMKTLTILLIHCLTVEAIDRDLAENFPHFLHCDNGSKFIIHEYMSVCLSARTHAPVCVCGITFY